MKNKHLFLLATLVLLGISAMAQKEQSEGISYGLRAGINFQNINGDDYSGDKLELDLLTGFHAGVVVQVPVAPDFYVQSGLLYTTKGAKSKELPILNTSIKLNPSYLELPINLLYKPLLGEGHLLLGFGPYVAYGIGGKAKLGSVEEDIKYTNSYLGLTNKIQNLKHFDFGGNLFFGYELSNGLSIQLNTQLGLVKINAENTNPLIKDEASFKNTGFGLSLGYMF